MGNNDKASVKAQYQNSNNLSTRISIHDKYSTNKQGFGNWIYSHYEIEDGMTVLELGCGTGSMWVGKNDLIQKCGKLIHLHSEELEEVQGHILDECHFKIDPTRTVFYGICDNCS